MAAAGIDVYQFLRSSDHTERMVILAVAKRVIDLKQDEHDYLASAIVHALSKAMK